MRGLLIYCTDYHCRHSIAISGDRRMMFGCPDLEPHFICTACGKRGARTSDQIFHRDKPGLLTSRFAKSEYGQINDGRPHKVLL
jgi:hypothetical protein